MYPSIKNIRYGIFVKNFVVSLEDDFEIKKTILTKKTGFSKLLGYVGFYIRIVKAIIRGEKRRFNLRSLSTICSTFTLSIQ